MYPILITTTFLMLTTLFASSQLSQLKMSALKQKLYEGHLASLSEFSDERIEAHVEDFKESSSIADLIIPKPDKIEERVKQEEKKPGYRQGRLKSLDINLARPPNNAKLNFYFLLHEPNPSIYPENFSFKECAAALMRALYGDQPFFQNVKGVEYKILDALIAQKDQTYGFAFADELLSCDLRDNQLQEVFYKMMQGSTMEDGHPSLCEYITYDSQMGNSINKKRINFLFAEKELLKILIPNEELAEALLLFREDLWDQLKDQEERRLEIAKDKGLNRSQVTRLLKGKIPELVEQMGRDGVGYEYYQKLFDLSLGKKGNILYQLDPITHTLVRKKILNPE